MINTTPLEICAVLIAIALYLTIYLRAIINNKVDYIDESENNDDK